VKLVVVGFFLLEELEKEGFGGDLVEGVVVLELALAPVPGKVCERLVPLDMPDEEASRVAFLDNFAEEEEDEEEEEEGGV